MEWPKTLALSELDKLRLESAVDESLRNRLKADPVSVLAERGIEVPEGVNINVVEDTDKSHTITLPAFVGSNLAQPLARAASGATTFECTTCTPTTPICIGSLASLICLGNK